jgi:hypothetical protein
LAADVISTPTVDERPAEALITGPNHHLADFGVIIEQFAFTIALSEKTISS